MRQHQAIVLAALLASATLAASCADEDGGEARSSSKYYLRNTTGVALHVAATDPWGGELKLIIDAVEPDSTRHFFTFVQGAGGNTGPGNAFGDILLTSDTDTIYPGAGRIEWVAPYDDGAPYKDGWLLVVRW